MANEAVKYSLLLLSGWGVYSVWIFASQNGLLSMMEKNSSAMILPGTTQPMSASFTGLEALDKHLQTLMVFFWNIIDGSAPDYSLQSFNFGGQIAATWMVLMVEGFKAGNSWRPISFLASWGVLMQNATFAVTFPAILAIHMFTSPTVSSTNADLYLIDPIQLAAAPFSLMLGFILPSAAMSLPAPSIITFETKQQLANLWQVFPIWVYVSQVVLTTAVVPAFVSTKQNTSLAQRKRATILGLRPAYLTAYSIANLTHISSVGVSLAAMLFPTLFTPDAAAALHPANVFIPKLPFLGSPKASSIVQGGLWFMQWDMTTGCTALLLWTTNMWINTQTSPLGTYTNGVWGSALLKRTALGTLLAGPVGAALGLMWERDELLLAAAGQDLQEGRKGK